MASTIPVNVRFVLCTLLPALAILLISWEIEGWLFGLVWLILAVIVLFYAIETTEEESRFTEQMSWLHGITGEDALADVVQKQEDFLVTTAYELFQAIMPVLFWFLLTGPAGALFYVLAIRYLDLLETNDPEVELVEHVVFWLEWLPARVTGLLIVFVGNFGASFEYWPEMLVDIEESNAVHLSNLGSLAVAGPGEYDTEDAVDYARSAESHINNLRGLFERVENGWLGLAALVTIVGW